MFSVFFQSLPAPALLPGSNSLLPISLPLLPVLQLFTQFSWAPSESDEVAGYAVYYQVGGLPITNRVDVGDSLSVTIPLLVGLRNSIFVVAYTADGVESEPSNILEYVPPPVSRLKLLRMAEGCARVQFRTSPFAVCQVEWTDDLTVATWQPLAQGAVMADINGDVVADDYGAVGAERRFYRAKKL